MERKQAVARVKELARNLSKQLLDPLREHLDEYENWTISPDGLTWYLPFGALLLDDSTYVVERHTVSYVTSGRDLLAPSSEAKTNGPLLAAAPNYNMGIPSSTPQNEPFGPLPGTEKEAKLITPLLKDLVRIAAADSDRRRGDRDGGEGGQAAGDTGSQYARLFHPGTTTVRIESTAEMRVGIRRCERPQAPRAGTTTMGC